MSLVLLLIYSAVPQDPGHAAHPAFTQFAGGLLQTLLSLAFWPLHHYRPERQTLAHLYQELATLDGDCSIENARFRSLVSHAEYPQQTGQPHALIDIEADRLTNAVNTLSEEVFRWTVPSGPA